MIRPRPTPEEWRDAYLAAVGYAGPVNLDFAATAIAERLAREREEKEKAQKPEPPVTS